MVVEWPGPSKLQISVWNSASRPEVVRNVRGTALWWNMPLNFDFHQIVVLRITVVGSLPTNSIFFFFCSTKDIESPEECFQGKLNDFSQFQGKFSPLIDHGFGGPWNQAFCFHLCPYLFYWPRTTKRSYKISLELSPNSSLHWWE